MTVVQFIKKVLLISTFFLLSFCGISNDLDKQYAESYHYSQQGEHKKAFAIMFKLANKNYPNAQHNVGLSYLYGLGVEKNSPIANDWLKKAVENGVLDAQTELAMSYYQGRGIAKNIKKAQQLWLLSSQKNDAYAQFNLASLFVEQTKIDKAVYWFKESLKNKHPKAKKALLQLEKKYD